VEKDGKPNPRVNKNMPANISKYHIFNEVNCFLYSKPLRKNKVKGETQVQEFADLWYLNFYHVTEDFFPTVHTRTEVVKKILVETTPIQNAISMILDKNREIQTVTAKQEAAGSTLTLVLKGVIDAAVNGGTALYTQAFLNDAYLQAKPSDITLCEQLHQGLEHQIPLLEEGLKVHARMCSAEMAGLQEQLEMQLKTMTEQLKTSSAAVLALFSRYQQYKTNTNHSGASPSEDVQDYSTFTQEQLLKTQGAFEARGEIALALLSANSDDTTAGTFTGLSPTQIQQVKQYGVVDTTALTTALLKTKKERSTAHGHGMVSSNSSSQLTSSGGPYPASAASSSASLQGTSTPAIKRVASRPSITPNSPGR
jgi:hypothetical protein